MQTDNNSSVIIIGSGMAGYSLARELRKLNEQLTITVICRDAGDNYSKPTLSNAFAQKKSASNIALANADKMAEMLNITVLNFHQVSAIQHDKQTITVYPIAHPENQQTLTYHSLVLATGASSRTLNQVKIDQSQIFAVNHLDDYRQFQQVLQMKLSKTNQPVKIAIVGAGLIGCEFANDLVSLNADSQQVDITIFANTHYPLAEQLPIIAGDALKNAFIQAGIQFQFGVNIIDIQTDNQQSKLIYTDAGQPTNPEKTFVADIVLLAIGLEANVELAKQAGIVTAEQNHAYQVDSLPKTVQQGIVVNQYLQTSIKNIYAIGDCVNVMGSFMPYVMPLMNQARALAKTLSDPTQPATAVSYPAMPVAIKTPSCPLVVLPVPQKYSDQAIWQQTDTTDGMVLTAHADNQLVGFVLLGKEAGKQRLTLSKQVSDWLSLPC